MIYAIPIPLKDLRREVVPHLVLMVSAVVPEIFAAPSRVIPFHFHQLNIFTKFHLQLATCSENDHCVSGICDFDTDMCEYLVRVIF